jgi:glycosyltransferase involved in cell wall biosynthesis
MDLSIVIPSYNQPKTIQSCLESLMNQQTNYQFEVIIVDSSNQVLQSEVEQICSSYKSVRIIKRAKQT